MKPVIKAFLLAGTIDIVIALTKFYFETGKNPVAVLNFIASGVFGKEAFGEGLLMAVLGLLFHYVITLGWTLLFYKLYPVIPFMRKNLIVTGLLYGLFVWLMMNNVVVPLSNTPPLPLSLMNAIVGSVIIMLAVGLPISLIIGKHYSGK